MHKEEYISSARVFKPMYEEMCNLPEEVEDITPAKCLKRKTTANTFEEIYIPPKRISPFFNTPKERNEERKKILKISVRKSKEIDNAEQFLRRTVLINNTMKRIQVEIRKDKLKQSRSSRKSMELRGERCSYSMLSSSMKNPFFYDNLADSETNEQIHDDMTDTLMRNLEEKLGGRIANISSIEDMTTRGSVTPVPWLTGSDSNDNSDLSTNQSVPTSKHNLDDRFNPDVNDPDVVSFSSALNTDNAQRGKISNDYFAKGFSFGSKTANDTTRHDKAFNNHLVHQTSNEHTAIQNDKADCDLILQNSVCASRIANGVTRFESEIDRELIQYGSDNCNSTEKEDRTWSDSVYDIPVLPERPLHQEIPIKQSSAIEKSSHCSFKVKPNYVLANG